MPFFETVVIARCGHAKSSSGLMKSIAESILSEGGTVREMKVLGDRALTKALVAKDRERHMVGRYLQVLYDGNLGVKKSVELAAKDHYDTMRYRTHRMSDYFYESQLYKKSLREQNLVYSEQYRNRQYVSELAKLMKENEEKTASDV